MSVFNSYALVETSCLYPGLNSDLLNPLLIGMNTRSYGLPSTRVRQNVTGYNGTAVPPPLNTDDIISFPHHYKNTLKCGTDTSFISGAEVI